jgi:hypothetical protein
VSPAEDYIERLRAREARVSRFQQLHARVGNARLLVAAMTVIAAWWSLQRHAFSPWWLLVPIAAFAGLVLYHYTINRARSRSGRAVDFYRRGLARIEDRWAGTGQDGARFDVPHHVYAADLDLFGKGSLFELLSSARTRMGEDTLAQWLLSPSSVETILARHACVVELRERLDFREELAVLGEDARVGVHPGALLAWAEAPNQLGRRWIRWTALLLPLLAVASAFVWHYLGTPTPLLLVLLIEAGLAYRLKSDLARVIFATESAFADLKLFSALLTRLEREPLQAPALQKLIRKLSSHTLEASRTIARLSRIVSLVESRRNPIMAVLDVPLMYSVNVALAAERWRHAHGKVVRSWIEVVGELEALLSIAAYSYEHPHDPFPEFADGPASFRATELGHPLIPTGRSIRNDVGIDGNTRVLLVSGSNMSGKSTLLRSVGINAVLAMAGAPVRARRLQLTPLQIGASIRINDSLHEGSSRFYAEITRLRQLHDLAGGDLPLLFLLDELLQGTNSKDRRIGAEGVVRAFLHRRAIGLISTHDLALTDIASLRNVHFQDDLVNGRMSFDFKLRDGPVAKSNGVELMRSIGLEV